MPSVPVAGVWDTNTKTFVRYGIEVSDHELCPNPVGRTGITAPFCGDTLVIGSGSIVSESASAAAVGIETAIPGDATHRRRRRAAFLLADMT
jgi:hypothetical protein